MFDETNEKSLAAFKEAISDELDVDASEWDVYMLFRHAMLRELADDIGEAFDEMRKHDLAQIGYVILSNLGEAIHNGWDGLEREEIEHWAYVLKDIKWFLEDGGVWKDTYDTARPWGFGGDEWWDEQGKRHSHQEEDQAD